MSLLPGRLRSRKLRVVDRRSEKCCTTIVDMKVVLSHIVVLHTRNLVWEDTVIRDGWL